MLGMQLRRTFVNLEAFVSVTMCVAGYYGTRYKLLGKCKKICTDFIAFSDLTCVYLLTRMVATVNVVEGSQWYS